MALVATVSKMTPTKNQVRARLKLVDEAETVIDKVFCVKCNASLGLVERGEKSLQRKMQAAIDDYKQKQFEYNSPDFDMAITRIQEGLVV